MLGGRVRCSCGLPVIIRDGYFGTGAAGVAHKELQRRLQPGTLPLPLASVRSKTHRAATHHLALQDFCPPQPHIPAHAPQTRSSNIYPMQHTLNTCAKNVAFCATPHSTSNISTTCPTPTRVPTPSTRKVRSRSKAPDPAQLSDLNGQPSA